MALVGLLLVSAPASACISSHHDGMGGMMGSGPKRAQDPVVAESGRVTVEIKDYDFFPRDLTVPAGATVAWVNRDSVPHDATSDKGGWATGMLKPGQERTLVFDESGAFDYLCTIHPDMKAKLVVRPDAAAANTSGRAAIQEG